MKETDAPHEVMFFVNPIDADVLIYRGDEHMETISLDEFERRRRSGEIRLIMRSRFRHWPDKR